jgi:hypothetical protein
VGDVEAVGCKVFIGEAVFDEGVVDCGIMVRNGIDVEVEVLGPQPTKRKQKMRMIKMLLLALELIQKKPL